MNDQPPYVSYEESVRWMRAQPELQQIVRDAYLDEDLPGAAKRFAASEEFAAVCALIEGPKSPLRILDIGCGNGMASWAWASRGHRVTAADPDTSAEVGLGAIKKLLPMLDTTCDGSITPIACFAEALPLQSGAFDVVYARQTLHHFQDLKGSLAECARVLKPGGVLLATREHVVSDDAQLARFLEAHPLQKQHGNENAHTLTVYLRALRGAGLTVTRTLAPYDSVINHFPISDARMKQEITTAFGKRLGPLAGAVMRTQFAENLGRALYSRRCDVPGRLFSWVCHKQ